MDKKKIYFDIYLLERLEDGTVNVYQKNLAGRAYFQAYNDRLDPILKEIAELKKIAWKKDTFSDNMAYSLMHQCGTPLRVGLYEIGEEKKGSDDDYLPIYKFDFAPNKIEVLRGIAERISFKYDLNWDANTLGVKLIDFMK